LKQFYEDILLLEDCSEKATYLNNLGYYQSKIGDYRSFENMSLAFEIRKKIGDLTGLFSSYRYFSLYFYDKDDKKKALKYAEKASEISNLLNSPTFKLEALELKLKLSENPDLEDYILLNKNIENNKLLEENKFAGIKYDVEKQEKIANEAKLQLKDSELIRAKQKSKITISMVVAIFVALLSLFMFYILKSKHTKEKEKKVLETEFRISKRIHDELANDVYSAMVQLNNGKTPVSEIVDDLEDIYHKARDLSQEKSTVKSNNEFIEDLKKSLASFNTDETNVIVKGLVSEIWIDVSNEKKLAVFRVIKELLVNMRKHSSASLVSVVFDRSNNVITIRYLDNGIGQHKNKVSKGLGLVNAENRIQAIGGNFIFDTSSEKGLKIMIEIPVQ
jgi:signal transduction histidine kinase